MNRYLDLLDVKEIEVEDSYGKKDHLKEAAHQMLSIRRIDRLGAQESSESSTPKKKLVKKVRVLKDAREVFKQAKSKKERKRENSFDIDDSDFERRFHTMLLARGESGSPNEESPPDASQLGALRRRLSDAA